MKKITNILKYIFLGTFILYLFPIVVFAEETYIVFTSGMLFHNVSDSNIYCLVSDNSSEVRAISFYNENTITSSTRIYFYLVSQNNFKFSKKEWSMPASATNNATLDYFYDGVQYYYTGFTEWNYVSSDVPLIRWDSSYGSIDNSYDRYIKAVDLTFGAGAIEPVVPTNWGLLRDTEYSTRIAGQGLAAKRNIDYLTWNNEVDSNGNDISECSIHIKAVLGSWSDTTEEGLLNKTYNDFNIGNYTAVDLGTVSASSGTFSVSWERIINEAGWNFDSLYSHLEDNIFLKQGWYYQICLVDPDGNEHQYQTLYTPLSSSAAASETVINHNSFDTSIYQVYQELSTINNNTSITINIEGTDYTITNPDDGDEPAGGTDLWDILKQMLNGIFQIVKNIAALPGKFLEMIQQLITPPQQISEEINTNFNNNMNVLEESQPGLVESMNAVEDLQDTLNQSVNSFDGVPQCMFIWDAVTLDLSAFQAGNVTFIPAGSFDFAASFMQMINGFGMTYAEYQFYVSAIIYAWILVFIYRHVYAFLAGTKEE